MIMIVQALQVGGSGLQNQVDKFMVGLKNVLLIKTSYKRLNILVGGTFPRT